MSDLGTLILVVLTGAALQGALSALTHNHSSTYIELELFQFSLKQAAVPNLRISNWVN